MSPPPKKAIILTGFMGSGKSTIGIALSTLSHLPLYHTDTIIENQTQTTISEIFDTHGEANFRALEKKLCTDLGQFIPCIFSTGGGTVLDPDNFRNLKKIGTIFFLDTPLEVILKRLEGVTDRPLFQSPKNAKALWTKRHPLYKQHCDVHLHAEDKSSETLASEIWTLYKETESGT